jgi:hypothetical protein
MYKIKLTYLKFEWWFHGTSWTCNEARADGWMSIDDANAALLNAKQFTNPRLYKLAQIIEQ